MTESDNKEKKEPVVVDDIQQLFAKPKQEEDDYILFNGKRVDFKFRNVSWARYNEIVVEAMNETSDNAELYERVKQEKIMKEMITEISGTRLDNENVKIATWAQLDSAFCETLRQIIFEDTGEMRVSGAMLKNLMPSLNEEIERMISTKQKSNR